MTIGPREKALRESPAYSFTPDIALFEGAARVAHSQQSAFA